MLDKSLSGIKVVDLTRLYPGPLCTLMLADMGATVIKVEAPGGELGRYIPPYQYGSGAAFLQMNRGKRSITLDLKQEKGKSVFRRLLDDADVLVESFRPGVMKRFGLDYAAVAQHFPQLVYCSISGYGQDGPYAHLAGHDLNYISLAGLISLSGNEQKGYLIPPVQIADVVGAFQAVAAISAALLQKFREKRGQHLDISLLDGALFTLISLAGIHFAGFPLQQSHLPLSGRLACYNVYRTKDNQYLALAFLEPKFWQTFCLKMKLDRYFNDQLQSNQTELIAALSEKIASKTLNEWLEFLKGDDLCVTPVKDFARAIADTHIIHRNMLFDVSYGAGKLKQFKTPFLRRPPETSPAPNLGEHTQEILTELGYSSSEIASLKREGVL